MSDKVMASAGKLKAVVEASCGRLSRLYGKRADDMVEALRKKECDRIREKSCCGRQDDTHTLDR